MLRCCIVAAAVAVSGCASTSASSKAVQPSLAHSQVVAPQEEDENAAPTTRTFWTVFERDLRRRCGPRCSFSLTGSSLMQLELSPNGQAMASDAGHLRREYRSVRGNTEELTQWTHSYAGSWTEGRGRLGLRLTATQTSCVRRRSPNAPKVECPKPKTIRARCVRLAVELDEAPQTEARAWRCRVHPRDAPSEASSAPWLFGITTPLAVIDAGRGRAFRSVRKVEKPN